MRLTERVLAASLAVLVLAATAPAGAVAGTPTGGPASTASASASAPTAAPTQSQAAAIQEQCSFPVTETDATGTEVTVEEDPRRVVVLQASTAQVMWELDLQDRVVGMPVTPYTAYLNGSKSKTGVLREDGSVDQEQVVALEPDLVVAPDVVPNETVRSLRESGLTVYKAGFPKSLDGIGEKVSLYGRLTGQCERAETVSTEFDAAVEEIRSSAADRSRPRTLYYFFNFTAGQGTFTNEVIEATGGRNVASEAGVQGYKRVNLEVVAERDPEVVFLASDSPRPSGEPWASTTAYREDRVVRVNTNLLNQPGPRVVEPMRKMSEVLAAAAENRSANGTATRTAGGDDEGEPTGTTEPADAGDGGDGDVTPEADSSGSGPGFGLASALTALVAAALLSRRRP